MLNDLQISNQEKIKILLQKKETDKYKKTENLVLRTQELERKYAETKDKKQKREIRELINSAASPALSDCQDYLELNSELNLRLVIDKYLNGETLTEDEIEIAVAYNFFNTSLLSPFGIEPGFVEFSMMSEFGSGEFTGEEVKLIKKISNTVKDKND